jgi:hypothetical protein
MKSKIFTFIVFIFLLFPALSRSQCFTILSVKGEIVLEKTGQPIKEMDEVCSTDKLIFSTKDSKAAVLSPEQGRYVIKLEKKNTNSLIAFVNSVINPGKERLSTKFIDFDELNLINLEFYKEEFGQNYFIIKESRVYIDSSAYKMNAKNYFYVKYIYEGKEIEKKLKYDKFNLILDKEIFSNNDIKIEPEKVESVTLYYADGKNNKQKTLSTFKISFMDEEKLKSELTNYIALLKKADKTNYIIIEEANFFVNDLYGNINYTDLALWLEANFGIK